MNTCNSSSFLSISNLKSLMTIFENFLKDRYDQNASIASVSLKEIIYETMKKIEQNKDYSNLSKTELNKITLSIVKNVVKSKFDDLRMSEPSSRKSTQYHVVDRPSMALQKNEKELNKEFQLMSKSREDLFQKPIPTQQSEKLDTAFSEQEFLDTLQEMEKRRDTQFGDVNMDSSLSSIFKKNQMANPKDLFEGSLESSDPLPEMNTILQDRTNFYIKPYKKPDKIKKYICIDSRERVDGAPSSYVVTFDEPIKNICSASLTHVMFSPDSNVGNELYVNLQIDEFNQDQFVSTNAQLKNSFAQLPLQGNTYLYANSLNENVLREFVIPLSVLSRLTVSFTKFGGEMFEGIGEHFIKIEIEHYNSIGGDLDPETNLNVFQNSLQEEVFLANDETENVHETLEQAITKVID